MNRETNDTRMHLYKSHGLTYGDQTRKRRDDEVRLRKDKRIDIFNNRRRISEIQLTKQLNCIPIGLLEDLKCDDIGIESAAISEILKKVTEDEWNASHLAENGIFSLLSDIMCNRNGNENIKELISKIMEHASNTPCYSKSFDTKCLVSLCSLLTENEDTFPIVVDTLQSISVFVGMNPVFRNIALDAIIVPALLNVYSKRDECVQRRVMWLVSQLFHRLEEYSPEVIEVLPLMEIVSSGMQSADPSIQADAIRACALMAEWPSIWEDMRNDNILSLLVSTLSSEDGVTRPNVLRAIDFITQTTKDFTEELLESGLLEKLKPLVNMRNVSRDVCFILSNLSAEGEYVIDRLIHSGVLGEVSNVMRSAEYSTRKEAAYTICNCCASTSRAHIAYVLQLGVLGSLTDLLTCMDASLVLYILEALEALLQYGEINLSPEYRNPVSHQLEEVGCKVKLEFLCQSQNVGIHAKAFVILERFFDEDDEEVVQYNTCPSELRTSIDNTIDAIVAQHNSPSLF